MLRNCIFFISLIGFFCSAYSHKWHRGLYQIDQIDSGIKFAGFGELFSDIEGKNLPLEFNKLAKFSANDSANLFFRMSTRILGKWEGPGKLSIEAFDHRWGDNQSSNELSNYVTRTIFYFNEGFLFINAEALGLESFILVEMPLGKVISYGGIFSIKLDEFKDSAQRNAVIECYEGSLVYTDQTGTANALSKGSKMPIIFKDGLFKVNRLKLDKLEQRAVYNFKKESVNFIEAGVFPEFEIPMQSDLEQKDEDKNKGDEIKKSYYLPIVEQMKSFNSYKKYYKND